MFRSSFCFHESRMGPGGLRHHLRITQNVLAVKGGLDEAALALPKVAFAGQQALAEDPCQSAIIRGLREITGITDKHRLYVPGMHYQVYRNMGEMHANHVSVFLCASLVKSQPVARHLDRTSKQESPFRPRGSSRKGFRNGCGCHNLPSILPANRAAVSQL